MRTTDAPTLIRIRASRRIILFPFAICILAYGVSSDAFKPKKMEGHKGITDQALRRIEVLLPSGGPSIKFSDKAIKEIYDANAGVDEFFSSRGEGLDPVAHCDDEKLYQCNARMVALKSIIVRNLLDDSTRNGTHARKLLGQALHPMQDFYSHSNWVDNPGLGNLQANTDIGTNPFGIGLASAGDVTCEGLTDDQFVEHGLVKLTSGYFSLGQVDDTPDNKCSHGKGLGGINKDEGGLSIPAGAMFFPIARDQATDTTERFVREIIDALGSNEDAIRAFLLTRPDAAFVVDRTGSMADDIAGVVTAINQIVAGVASNQNAPDRYVLVTFTDPSIDRPIVSNNLQDLSQALATIELQTQGNIDCPEPSNRALITAIETANAETNIFLFTDASSNDAHLAAAVKRSAKEKNIRISYILTGSCSPIDPVYYDIAAATGGQVIVLTPSETADVAAIIEPTMNAEPLQLLAIYDNRNIAPGQPDLLPFLPDSTVERLVITTTWDSAAGPIVPTVYGPPIDPNTGLGSPIDPNDPNVTITNFSGGQVVTIDAPAVGGWEVWLENFGIHPSNVSVKVEGVTPIALEDFDFVSMRGRPDHEGYFPIEGSPSSGLLETGLARVSGPGTVGLFQMIGPSTASDGIVLEQGGNGLSMNEYIGAVDFYDPFSGLFPTDFRVWMLGTDPDGNEFTRISAEKFQLSPLFVIPVAADMLTATTPEERNAAREDQVNPILAGSITTVYFEVFSFDYDRALCVSFASFAEEVAIESVAPQETILNSYPESKIVSVTVRAPLDAANVSDLVTLVATPSSFDPGNPVEMCSLIGVPNQADSVVKVQAKQRPRGDQNGDRKSDVLFRNSTNGANQLYTMDGMSIVENLPVDSVSPDWLLVGRGDYDGDGNSDILWRHAPSGAHWMYRMDGSVLLSVGYVATVSDSNWKVVGSGDYDGDGMSDLLWHHQISGTLWLYAMNGDDIAYSAGIGVVPDTNWQVVGSGDYNGDGKVDVLWRNFVTGTNWMYLMDGSTIIDSGGVSVAPDQSWQIVGSGDYDGNGKSDVFWRNSASGANWIYLMDGIKIAASDQVSTVPDTSWIVAGDGDYDGDGKSDVLWRSGTTGSNWMYLMDGANIKSSDFVSSVPDLSWKIVYPN